MNAIILSAGLGSRLWPHTSDTPKSLIEIDGVPIIERHIEHLRAAGVLDITIVVGHLDEAFVYLVNKFNVNLIKNVHYRDYSNFYSLYLAVGQLCDTWIIEGDTFFVSNPYKMLDCATLVMGRKRYLNGESYIAIDKVSRVVEVNPQSACERVSENKFGHLVPCGITFLNKETSEFVKRQICSIISDHSKVKSMRSWDYILYLNLVNIDLYAHVLSPYDWYEIDSEFDLEDAISNLATKRNMVV